MKIRIIYLAAAISLTVQLSIAAGPPAKNDFFALCMDIHDSKKRTLTQQAELLKELGYAGAGHLWLKNVPERLKTLDAAGLKLFQIYMRVNIAPGKKPYDPKLPEVLPLLKDRRVQLALLVTGGKPSDPKGDPHAVEIIQKIADLAKPHGVTVVLYPHSRDWLERVEDGVRVAKKVDRKNVGVMFNLCHWLRVDDEKNLEPLLTAAKPYLMAVSIHGSDKGDLVRRGKGNWIQPLGSGSFEMDKLIRLLRKLEYKGPIGLQCYGIKGDARDHLAKSMEAWKKLQP